MQNLIPGKTQLFSRRPDLYCRNWPFHYSQAHNCRITDISGKTYIDTLSSIGSIILGYCDFEVTNAVNKAVSKSPITTLNSPAEIELAELLVSLNPWADMVRYAKTGGEATAIAVRIARAHTGKDKVAIGGYHGWTDWYLAANLTDNDNLTDHLMPGLNPRGVPKGLQNTAFPFYYNSIHELEEIVLKHDIGTIIMEPMRFHYPKDNFLQKVRKIADDNNIILIFDEITSAFRTTPCGIHTHLGVTPDIAVYGKAMSNGFACSAIVGKRDIMESAEDTFISSSYWSDAIGLSASIATIQKLISHNVAAHVKSVGTYILLSWEQLAEEHNIPLTVTEFEGLPHFEFEHPESQALLTLFTQEMLKEGYLTHSTFYVNYAHNGKIIRKYLKSVDKTFGTVEKALKGDISDFLECEVAKKGFQRLT